VKLRPTVLRFSVARSATQRAPAPSELTSIEHGLAVELAILQVSREMLIDRIPPGRAIVG
jgi:hypothetical protein